MPREACRFLDDHLAVRIVQYVAEAVQAPIVESRRRRKADPRWGVRDIL